MEEELETSLMHHQRFGEGQRFANKTSQTLSKRIVPAFRVGRFTSFLSGSGMLVLCNHRLIGDPAIGEAVTYTLGEWNDLPQATTGLFASISHRVSHDLSRLAA